MRFILWKCDTELDLIHPVFLRLCSSCHSICFNAFGSLVNQKVPMSRKKTVGKLVSTTCVSYITQSSRTSIVFLKIELGEFLQYIQEIRQIREAIGLDLLNWFAILAKGLLGCLYKIEWGVVCEKGNMKASTSFTSLVSIICVQLHGWSPNSN